MPEQTSAEARDNLEAAAADLNTEAPAPPLNAVVVTREINEKGDITIESHPTGNVLVTEIPSILAFAEKRAREKLGI